MLFFSLAVVVLSLLLAALSWRPLRRLQRVRHLAAQFPGPKTVPLIGNGHLFFGLNASQAFILMAELYEQYGDTVRIWLGPSFSVLLSKPQDVEAVLGSTQLLNKSYEYDFLRNWLNEGLLVSRGRKWFKRRKVLTPAFHFKILEQFVEIFDRQARHFVSNLDYMLEQGERVINLGHGVHLCALDVICETAMGVSINAQTNVDSDYVRAVKTISMVLHKRMFNILYRFDWTYMFTGLARAEKKALHVLHSFTEKIIVQRREELLRSGSATKDSQLDDVGGKRKMAFLDILLQSTIDGKSLTNMDIREEVDTFMFEGHDTTSSAIMFFFYNIALYPEAQRKCFEEISSAIDWNQETPINYESLNRLHYIDLCIKETLRMYPSVPLLGRKVVEECEINGKIIPAGTNLGISPLHLGRREDLFSEANTFKPERFDVVTSAEKMNPYAYIPFSAGPRNCIGQKFAILEIKTMVTNVLRHFEVEFVGNKDEPPVLIAELILRTRDPLMFRLKKRSV